MEDKDNDKSTPTKGFVQVYKSTDSVPCEPWFAPADAEVAYPFTADKPDDSLKTPKYDWANRRWFETDSATTGQALASINETVQDLSKQVQDGQADQEAINQQIGSLASLLSATAVTQNTNSDKSEKAEEGGNK